MALRSGAYTMSADGNYIQGSGDQATVSGTTKPSTDDWRITVDSSDSTLTIVNGANNVVADTGAGTLSLSPDPATTFSFAGSDDNGYTLVTGDKYITMANTAVGSTIDVEDVDDSGTKKQKWKFVKSSGNSHPM